MTTNQTIDGVPREFVREGRYIVVKPDYEDDLRTERLRNYIEEMCFHTPDCVVVEADWPEYEPVWRMIEARVTGNPTELDAAKATISKLQGLVAELRALLDSEPCAKSQAQPDPALCKFYDVSDWSGLVRELVGHVALLQDSAKRNVKPWEDTFPPTLMPAYIERVNTANAAAQPQGEPFGYWLFPKGLLLHGMFHRVTETDKIIDSQSVVEAFEITPLYAEQPVPVASACPAHANPPPGTEPCGAHHDNDGLDEWRK